MEQNTTELPKNDVSVGVTAIQIDTALYTPTTDIDWKSLGSEVAAQPDGSFVIYVRLAPSTQWMDSNPTQLAQSMAPFSGAKPVRAPSLFSDVWVAEVQKLITRLAHDLIAQSWFSRVDAVCIKVENYAQPDDDGKPTWGDYSALSEEHFNAWMWDGNRLIPECASLIPSTEWRSEGVCEYLMDSPMGVLSGQFNMFMSESVSLWYGARLQELNKALSAKCKVGVCTNGRYFTVSQSECQWGALQFSMLLSAAPDVKCAAVLGEDTWLPVDSLTAKGVHVYGKQPANHPQVAFVVHEPSRSWIGHNAVNFAQCLHLREMIESMGVGVWDGLLGDIELLPDSVILVVVANAWVLSRAEISSLLAAMRKGKRTYLVIGAVAFIDPETGDWNIDKMQSVLDIPVQMQLVGGNTQCSWVDKIPYGGGVQVPRFTAKLVSLVQYEDGTAASGQRWLPSGKLHWCACAPLHPPFLRVLLKEAEVSLADDVSAEVQK